jgi:flagellin-like hook-associated protein FlgL
MLAPIGGVNGAYALGGAATQPRDGGALGALTQAGTLTALDSGRGGIDGIKAELGKLRDALVAARKDASTVPGASDLTPIVSDVEQTRELPTFLVVDGQPVQSGTITVSLGTRQVIVGYEAGSRPSLAVRDAVGALSTSVSQLLATVGRDSAGSFASDVSALLKSRDLATAVAAPDAASIDAALGQIDGVLAKAAGLRSSLGAQVSAAAQVDLSGVLLSAQGASPPSGQ